MARSARVNAYHRAWGLANRENKRIYNKRWRERYPEKWAELQRRAKFRRRGEPSGAYALWRRYKLRPGDWEAMFEAQGGCCAICKRVSKNPRDSKRPLVVDHCHKTNKVRGLLCHNCNLTLGKYDDDPNWFDLIAVYLRKHAPAETT